MKSATGDDAKSAQMDFELDASIIAQSIIAPPGFQAHHLGKGSICRGRHKLKKNRLACFKPAMDIKEVVLDHEDLCGRVISLQKCALIGRWMFADGHVNDMLEWAKNVWSPIVGYAPKVSPLLNNWYSIHFMNEKDVALIVNKTWVRGKSFLQLLPWYLGFNPIMEAPKNRSVWVKLPGLPLEFWTDKALRAIGNSIGCTKYIDPGILDDTDNRIAWILVEMVFSGGLPADVDLVWGSRRHRQRVDYWGIPFRCLVCHSTGYLKDNCPRLHWRPRGGNHRSVGANGKLSPNDHRNVLPSGNSSLADSAIDLSAIDNDQSAELTPPEKELMAPTFSKINNVFSPPVNSGSPKQLEAEVILGSTIMRKDKMPHTFSALADHHQTCLITEPLYTSPSMPPLEDASPPPPPPSPHNTEKVNLPDSLHVSTALDDRHQTCPTTASLYSPASPANPPPSPHNSANGDLLESPINTIGCDVESLFNNPNLDLAALTIFENIPRKPDIVISPASGCNITVRKKTKSASRHFRGRPKTKSLFRDELLDLREVPIFSAGDPRVDGACDPPWVSK